MLGASALRLVDAPSCAVSPLPAAPLSFPLLHRLLLYIPEKHLFFPPFDSPLTFASGSLGGWTSRRTTHPAIHRSPAIMYFLPARAYFTGSTRWTELIANSSPPSESPYYTFKRFNDRCVPLDLKGNPFVTGYFPERLAGEKARGLRTRFAVN